MTIAESLLILTRIRRKFVQAKVLLYALQAFAFMAIGSALLYKWGFEVNGIALIAITMIFSGLLYFTWNVLQVSKVSLQQVAQHLDRKYPALEDSTTLLLHPEADHSLLQRLQQQKTAIRLQEIVQHERAVYNLKPFPTIFTLSAALILAAGILYIPSIPVALGENKRNLEIKFPDRPTTEVPDTIATIEQIQISVTPPGYTGIKAYQAEQPNIKVEQGAKVTWKIRTSRKVNELQFVLNETDIHNLNGQDNLYTYSRIFTEPALYHINLDGHKSSYYTIEVVPDNAPAIQIAKPAQYTEILFGQPQKIIIQAQLSDDYGLRDASMIATVAKGTGEAVKFREEKISIGFKGNTRNFDLNKTLDLKHLNMTYGDELYFYIQAWDTYRGYTRSETYFVQIEDTTIVESMDDLSMGINPVPEYFRSQRQIIIDTEKLITEQRKISKHQFEEKSNLIGVDQKLLRLRYGKFLGEEFESGIGPGGGVPGSEEHSADDGHDHGEDFESRNSAEALLDPYLHKHDQEEAATFFEPAIKAKLKGALAQMWEAELRLRTHRPKEALPFEYKALRMLKEVQQSTRAYAAKTGFEAPPLKEPEKRLSGDLTKISVPSDRHQVDSKAVLPHTKEAIKWLAGHKQGVPYQRTDAAKLEQAGKELAQQALEKPGRNLRAMQDLRTIIANIQAGDPLCTSCLLSIERTWHEMLPPATLTPQQQTSSRSKLAEKYLKALKDN